MEKDIYFSSGFSPPLFFFLVYFGFGCKLICMLIFFSLLWFCCLLILANCVFFLFWSLCISIFSMPFEEKASRQKQIKPAFSCFHTNVDGIDSAD